MTKSHLLSLLGRDKRFMDFELFAEAMAPASFGGRAFDLAYMGFDFIGYSKLRERFLLINSWRSEEDGLFEISKSEPASPEPFVPHRGAA